MCFASLNFVTELVQYSSHFPQSVITVICPVRGFFGVTVMQES